MKGQSTADVGGLANRLCSMPGVTPGESSAPVSLSWVERLWRVAFVCGPQLAGLQRTLDEPSGFEIVSWLIRVRSKEIHLRRFGQS